MALLDAQGLVAGYAVGHQVLHGVSLSLDPSGVTAMSGVNGAGKTTLANALAGRLPVTLGRITFNGRDITHIPVQERVRLGIVLCPQGREIFPDLSVMEHLRIGALNLPKGERSASIDEILASIPVLSNFLDVRAKSLSGGQQQLLAVGRAVVARPRVLIVDEPSMGLAPAIVDTIYDYLRALHERGTALLVIEESPLRLVGLADHLMILRRGIVAREGGSELLRDETVLTTALLGEQEP